MITSIRFNEIEKEVRTAVAELFDRAAKDQENYILWLADADYLEDWDPPLHNPYVLSNKQDYYKEYGRMEFSQFYLNKVYNMGKHVDQTIDHPLGIQFEMMIYCHIWESNRFLKQLFRLDKIASGHGFRWKVSMPTSHKNKFIRKLKKRLKNGGLKIGDIIDKGFHNSIRKSFLHTEFEINDLNKLIELHTYRVGPKESHDIDQIDFASWTERFIYSVMFDYTFMNEKVKRRKNIVNDWGRDDFQVQWPTGSDQSRTLTIYFDHIRGDFDFQRVSSSDIQTHHEQQTEQRETSENVEPEIGQSDFVLIDVQIRELIRSLISKMSDKAIEGYFEYWLFDIEHDIERNEFISLALKDDTRLQTTASVIHEIYIEKKVELPIEIRIQIELLIYSWIWESKPFLRLLRNASIIISGDGDLGSPLEQDRRKLISEIVMKFEAGGCELGTFINSIFYPSLRNAFAHSDYDLNLHNKLIILDTFRNVNSDWDISSISFDDWNKCFLGTVALDYIFILVKDLYKETYPKEFLQTFLDELNKSNK
ncbi:hypothetical protein [Chitinophaga rhizophila]|uniref:ApeA N-terminal domain-containing protein n=1 Tax=Chitinophaga rhizophila TaxID=2866212 RepID=A0ABS7G6Z4_9BACT|nr:hypothetical protein [Chitinophaga rhizophila]MBW8683427.1 hypothetical protein [Chitinophaga rhizophila]